MLEQLEFFQCQKTPVNKLVLCSTNKREDVSTRTILSMSVIGERSVEGWCGRDKEVGKGITEAGEDP